METARIVLTTCATKDQAQNVAHALLAKRLIACATCLPGAFSKYRWEGKIVEEAETVMLLKTTEDKVQLLERELVTLHPYRVPEFIVLAPERLSVAYAQWLTEQVSKAEIPKPEGQKNS